MICLRVFLFPEINHCHPNPCQNDGDCVETGNGYNCHCQAQYLGQHCEGVCVCVCVCVCVLVCVVCKFMSFNTVRFQVSLMTPVEVPHIIFLGFLLQLFKLLHNCEDRSTLLLF